MRESNFGPVVNDEKIATNLQHVLTINIPVRATVRFERDRFSEFMGIEGPPRAECKLVSHDRVLAAFRGRRSVVFINLLVDRGQVR